MFGLVGIGNNSLNAFHREKIHVETTSEQSPPWPIVSPRYLKVDSTWKLSFPILTSLKDAIAGDTVLPEHLRHTRFLLLVRWSVFPEDLLWTHRSQEVHKWTQHQHLRYIHNKGVFDYLLKFCYVLYLRPGVWFCWFLHVSHVIKVKSSRLQVCFEDLQRSYVRLQDSQHIVISTENWLHNYSNTDLTTKMLSTSFSCIKEVWYNCSVHCSAHLSISRIFLQYGFSIPWLILLKKFCEGKIMSTLIRSSGDSWPQA